MKRMIALAAVLVCVLSLSGCNGSYPDKAQDGTPWDKNWTILSTVLGVEEPGYDLKLIENPVVLTGDDTHYASWGAGEPSSFVNEDGHDTDLYPAQLYLLLYGCSDGDSAQKAVEEWTQRESETYTVTGQSTLECNGQTYTILSYTTDSDSNPFQCGAVAFTVYDHYAVSAELSCTAEFDGDEATILSDFLSGCHYAAQ